MGVIEQKRIVGDEAARTVFPTVLADFDAYAHAVGGNGREVAGKHPDILCGGAGQVGHGPVVVDDLVVGGVVVTVDEVVVVVVVVVVFVVVVVERSLIAFERASIWT